MNIGQHMKIEKAFDEIQFNDAIPVLEFKGYVYFIDYEARSRGQLYYTKFEKDLTTPIHTVHMPYSKNHYLGEVLDRGEGLQKKLEPVVTILPAAVYSIIQCKPGTIINKPT